MHSVSAFYNVLENRGQIFLAERVGGAGTRASSLSGALEQAESEGDDGDVPALLGHVDTGWHRFCV